MVVSYGRDKHRTSEISDERTLKSRWRLTPVTLVLPAMVVWAMAEEAIKAMVAMVKRMLTDLRLIECIGIECM